MSTIAGPPRATLLAIAAVALLFSSCARPLPVDDGMTAARGACRGELVDWIVPADPHDRSVLDAWCAAVGAPVMHEAPGSTTATADSLLVVAWNINVGGGDLLRFVADLRSGTLTGGARVEHFVLLVQEAFRAGDDVPPPAAGARGASRIAPAGAPRIAIGRAAADLGLHLLYVPSMRNGMALTGEPAEDRGNAILSTVALHEPGAIELPYEAQRRVAVSATLPGQTSYACAWQVRLTSVHLDHRSRLERGFATFGPGRARQARALASAIDHADAVVGGDLNNWAPAMFEGAKTILRDHFPDTPESDGAPTITFAGILSRRIDHVMSRLNAAGAGPLWRIDDAYGSDHNPVAGWVFLDGDCGP